MKDARLKIRLGYSDHFTGDVSAPLILVEYGDFECPYCAEAFPVFEKIARDFRSDICFVFRHFPLRNLHRHAELAALASEAANMQGRFWEMHRLLFQNSDSLSQETILLMAEALNLDVPKFRSDLASDEAFEKIQADFLGGVRSGVTGTPAVFLNDFRYEGPRTYPIMSEMIGDILGRARAAGDRP